MGERDRGDRPKKSWRDIDSNRDRSRGSEPPRSPGSQRQADQSSKQHRATLDALFEKGELGKFAEKMAAPAARSAPTPAAEPKRAEPAPKPVEREEDPRSVLRKKILASIGRDEISRSVDKYVKAHGMPEDFEILEQALEHQKSERIVEALNALEGLLARDKPKRSRTLAGKLRFIEETSDDPDLQAHAARVRAKLPS